MLYTNRPTDTVRHAFDRHTKKACSVMLACPFFSNADVVKDAIRRGCIVRLVVRFSRATDPAKLKEAMAAGAQIRFFTSPRFHSKLYIFGDDMALVGSANLTDAGVQSNQEICVGLAPDDHRYDSLVRVFQSYWDEAMPLDDEKLKTYSALMAIKTIPDEFEDKIKTAFGDIAASGIQVDRPKKSKDKVYLDGYRKTYQEFLHAFGILEGLYKADGRRQQPDEVAPLRLEIDMFLSFVREQFAIGDSYLSATLMQGDSLRQNVGQFLNKWHEHRWPYLDNIIPNNYASIKRVLGDEESLEASSYSNIVDAVEVCHSFHELLRFYKGGTPTVRKEFMSDNAEARVRTTLKHLLFDRGDFIIRMGECIFDPGYTLHHFGRSCVQELYGWINNEGVPICNGRTVKSLKFLGFEVKLF